LALVLIAGPTAGLTTPPYAFAAETAQTEKSTGLVLNPLNINAEQAPVPSITEQGDAYTIGATRTATRLDLSHHGKPHKPLPRSRADNSRTSNSIARTMRCRQVA
jgi:outer membrane receptor for ferric coprogen and ferric-rhodotorulic acid